MMQAFQDGDGAAAQRMLLMKSVYKDGKQIGAKIDEVPFKISLKLITLAMEANGFGDEGNEN